MPAGGSRARTAVLLALVAFVALLLFAHSPLLRAGLFGWDHAALLAERSPAARWSLVSRFSAEVLGSQRALAWRLESLLILAGTALAARAFLTRLLEPRLGAHGARAAALVAALLLPLHPAAPAATAELAGRGEAAGLLLGLAAGALFLRGRQEERDLLTAASLVLLAAAGWASPVAGLLGLAFAGAEFLSVRRHRPRALRLRTTATTALIFCAGGGLPGVLAGARPAASPLAGLPVPEAVRELVLGVVGELGRIATAPASGLGGAGVLLAGGLLLLALQPAFPAARSAPRLWGGILVGWSAALLAGLFWARSGGSARILFALTAWSAGLGLTLTALARPQRALRAAALALGWAVLAHAAARPWLAGSQALDALRAEIEALAPPERAHVLVLDPPEVVGLPPLARDLGWMFPGPEGSRPDPRRVQALPRAAFLALARTDDFARLRALGLAVLVSGRGPDGARGRREAVRVPGPGADEAERASWRGDLKYRPDSPLDPLEIGLVRLVAELASPPRELERLSWRTPAAEAARADSGSVPGRVSERGGRRVAEFDLEDSLEWRLAGSVAALLVKNGVRAIERGELLAHLPAVPGAAAPVIAGGDWWFAEPRLAEPAERGAHLVLGLLALDDLERVELALEPDPALPPGTLRARGAQRFVARKARAGAPVAWELEYRVGAQALLRSRGSAP